MKLYIAPTSPFARKARVTLIEKGLEEQVETIIQNPFEDSAELVAANPLKRVPVLVDASGTAIFDSPVICAYLDSLGAGQQLVPSGAQKWAILTGQAMADGVLDAAFAIAMERRRPTAEQSDMWLGRWEAAISRTLDTIDADLSSFEGEVSLAQIALGCALGYLNFRLPDLEWSPNRANLSNWFEDFETRPSMVATVPSNS